MAEGRGGLAGYVHLPPCCWPSQQLHRASQSPRSANPSHHRGLGEALTPGLLARTSCASSMTACVPVLLFSPSLYTSLSSGRFCFCLEKTQNQPCLVFPFSRQHRAGLTHQRWVGLGVSGALFLLPCTAQSQLPLSWDPEACLELSPTQTLL